MSEKIDIEGLRKRTQVVRDWDWWSRLLHRDYYGAGSEAVSWDEAASAIVADLGLEPGMAVIDLGAGSGELTLRLALHGLDAIGLDISHSLVDECRHVALDRGIPVTFVAADMFTWDPGYTVDAVVCINTSFGYGSDEANRSLMKRIASWLNVGGALYIDVIAADNARAFGVWTDNLAGGRLVVDNTYDADRHIMTSRPYWAPAGEEIVYAADAPEMVQLYTEAELVGMMEESGLKPRLLKRSLGRRMRWDARNMTRTWIARKEA